MIIKNPLYIVPPRGTYVQDTTATPADVLYPKEFYQADGQKVQGTIPTYAGAVTVTPSDTAQTLGTQEKYVESDIVVNPIPSDYKITPKDVTFYDYDGEIVKTYTTAEFAELTALPANPTHTGLVADGWNWTLVDAKAYVASYGKLNIGQIYHTESGKTEFDIAINEETGLTVTLQNTSDKDWGDGTVDGNTSHTYANYGNYTIKMGGSVFQRPAQNMILAVRLGASITWLRSQAFYDCRLMKTITLTNSITGLAGISSEALSRCYSLKHINIPSSVTNIDTYAFYSNHSLRSVSIPNTITTITNGVLSQCYSLQDVTIPSSVTQIGESTFSSCYKLETVIIPSSVTYIGYHAFDYCSSLKSINIPNGVTTLAANAFSGCILLQTVTLPSSITSIAANVFSGCSWLKTATVLATTPPTLANSNAFPSTVEKIYIPAGTLNDYLAEANWSDYYNSDPTLNRLWELNGVISGVLNVNKGRATLSQGTLEVN